MEASLDKWRSQAKSMLSAIAKLCLSVPEGANVKHQAFLVRLIANVVEIVILHDIL